MKRLTYSLFFLLISIGLANAQVFNTSSTLKKGQFSAGFEPAFKTSGGYDDFYLYLHGGAGIASGVDLGLKIGVLGDETYFGGDVEFALGKKFSISAGAHSFYDFGLDGTALFTFPIVKGTKLFTGLDMDINFYEDETRVPLWIPLGVQIGMGNSMVFILETNINVTDDSYHFLGGGLNFFF